MSCITNDIDLVVNELHQGHVVALPTETVYGLAADATQESAIKKIFTIKARPSSHPLIMHVGKNWDLNAWVELIPDYAQHLMEVFWPGPLTLVFRLKKTAHLSPLITGGQDTIAIRCPAHPLALEVLDRLGNPIVAPSANPFGKISPTQAQHVEYDFPTQTFYILDGGSCKVGIESTIIDATLQNQYRILRHGMISLEDIHKQYPALSLNLEHSHMKVSGNLKQHYQPSTPLKYFSSSQQSDVNKKYAQGPKVYVLSFDGLNAQEAAHGFYEQLRQADRDHFELILVELPPDEPEWAGLRDRIFKAGRPIT